MKKEKSLITKLIIILLSVVFTSIVIFVFIEVINFNIMTSKDLQKEIPAEETEEYISEKLQNQLIDNYIDLDISGAHVLATVKRYYTIKGLTEISVDGVNYSINAGKTAEKIENLSSNIKSSDKYKIEYIRTSDGQHITGIVFTKEIK